MIIFLVAGSDNRRIEIKAQDKELGNNVVDWNDIPWIKMKQNRWLLCFRG